MSIKAFIAGQLASFKALRGNTEADIRQWNEATVRPQDLTRYLYTINVPMSQYVERCVQWVAICSRLNAGACSQARLRLYRRKKSGFGIQNRERLKMLRDPAKVGIKAAEMAEGEIEEIEKHPVLDLIRNPSPTMSGHEFAELRFMCRFACGNSFFYAVGPEEGKEPEALLFLYPQYTTVVVDKANFLDGAMYGRDSAARYKIPQECMLHFKHYSSINSPFYGDPPASAVLAEADLFRYATIAETNRWQNEGRPPFLVTLPPEMGKDQARIEIESINRQIRGLANTGNGLVTQATDFKMMGWTAKEMEYTKGMERTERMIWAAYHVPESIIRPNEGALATAAVANGQWMRMAITPALSHDASDLTHKLLPMYSDTEGMFFAYDSVVPEDQAAKTADLATKVAAGLITLDEGRKLLGLPPHENGLGAIPRINGTALTLTQPGVPIVEETGLKCTCIRPMSRKSGEGAVESAFQTRLTGWFNTVLASIEAQTSQSVDISITGNQIQELERIIREETANAYTAGGQSRNPDFEMVPSRTLDILANERALVIEQVTDTTLNQLREAIQGGLAKGDSVPQILREVQSQGYSENRAATIARTETGNAFDLGNQAAMKEAGAEGKAWSLAGGPCPLCEAIVAAIIAKRGSNFTPVDEPFLTAAEMQALGAGKLSRDLYAAKGHPDCRCDSLSVMKKPEVAQ